MDKKKINFNFNLIKNAVTSSRIQRRMQNREANRIRL